MLDSTLSNYILYIAGKALNTKFWPRTEVDSYLIFLSRKLSTYSGITVTNFAQHKMTKMFPSDVKLEYFKPKKIEILNVLNGE